MTRDEMAKALDGREYSEEMTRDEEKIAKDSRLLVVFGASDDLVEFRGIIDDEVGAYGDVTEIFGYYNILDKWQFNKEKDSSALGTKIKAIWAESGSPAWQMSTNTPHASFNIMEDGEVYCVGIVIDEIDLFRFGNIQQ